MVSRTLLRSVLLSFLSLLFAYAHTSLADSSHARIIRLSLVQGDVRFARDVQGDPLANQTATWEAAEANLPVRQGYVLATDRGRAEIEFENGTMAFVGDNTVLEFYDLSLEDGARTTRLILRQGTASFFVNPAGADYFSVTGGDFTVEAAERSSFRLDNFDDGSVVNVSRGHVSVLRKDKPTTLAKGQSLTIHAGDDKSVSVSRLQDSDDFDRWVSGRVDTVVTATTASQQYVNSPYYVAGAADLYTYGSWYNVAGCGMCWRPYGVGLGWAPFSAGSWFGDPAYGMSFIGSEPWGWLPYHYGGWIYDPVLGWVWDPAFGGYGFYGGGYGGWAPVTGVFMRSKTGLLGIVPVHPMDAKSKTPVNLARGIFPVSGGAVAAQSVAVNAGEQWKAVKTVPANTFTANLAATTAPVRTSRTVIAGNFGTRVIALDHGSSIAYDPVEHRFVNTSVDSASPAKSAAVPASRSQNGAVAATKEAVSPRTATPPAATRTVSAQRNMTPPPAPHAAAQGWRGESGGNAFDAFHGPSAAAVASSSHASAASSSGAAHPH
jgi:FecR protein